jgi:hypothetical protein
MDEYDDLDWSDVDAVKNTVFSEFDDESRVIIDVVFKIYVYSGETPKDAAFKTLIDIISSPGESEANR